MKCTLCNFTATYSTHNFQASSGRKNNLCAQQATWQLTVNDARLKYFTQVLPLPQLKMDESRAVFISKQMPPSPGMFHYQRLQIKETNPRQQIHGA